MATVRRALKTLFASWATKSLLVGAVATALDVGVLLLCVRLFSLPNPAGAAIGVTVGGLFAYLLNRAFAFEDTSPVLQTAPRYLLSWLLAMALHAGMVYVLADLWSVSVVLAKLLADVLVFSGGHLLMLRYFVFKRPSAAPPGPVISG